MKCLEGVRFNDNTNGLREMRPSEQTEVLEQFFDEDNNHYLHQMLVAVCDHSGSPEDEATQTKFADALAIAFWAVKSRTGAEQEKFLAELGRVLVNHAFRFAEGAIDAYIEDNWGELVAASNEPDPDYGRD